MTMSWPAARARYQSLKDLRSAPDGLVQSAQQNAVVVAEFTTAQERARFLAIRDNIKTAIATVESGTYTPPS